MKSMTGFGQATYSIEGKELTIEIKSVNGRFLEVNSRLPKQLSPIEDIIVKTIQKTIKRGTVDFFVTFTDSSAEPKQIEADMALIGGYLNAAEKILERFPKIQNDLTMSALFKMPDVIKQINVDQSETLKALAKTCAEQAVEALDRMRETEGASIQKNLTQLLDTMQDLMQKVAVRAPAAMEENRQKLLERVTDALSGVEVDQSKLLNEVAFYADRSDINEEISRMNCHIEQFSKVCKSNEECIGRKLDFLSQEMVRETNTMCSKSSDTQMTGHLVELKNYIEKLKEQIRNIE